MKRKNYWILFAILLLSLTSLSPSIDFTQRNSKNNNNNTTSPESFELQNKESSNEPITISVQLSIDDFNKLDIMNKRFVKETGIQAQLTNISENNAYDEVSQSLAIRESPDVLLMESEWVKTFAAKGYLLPVESYRKSTPDSNVLRSLLALVEWNGYQWATPFDMDPYVLVWQSKMLMDKGIRLSPSTNEEWIKLLDIQMQRKGKPLLGIESEQPYALAALIGGMGGDILQPEDQSLAWIEMALPYMYRVSTNDKQQALQSFMDGEMLMYLAPYSASKTWNDGLGIDFPEHFYAKSPSFLRSRSFGVSSQSSLTEQASEWIAFMTAYSIQQEWFSETNRLPSLSAIYENPITDSFDIPFRVDVLRELNSGENNSKQLTNNELKELAIHVNQLLTGVLKVSQFKEEMLDEKSKVIK
ncbi:extracellular solute-binding protein [Paenibacillus antarcticus]|uniref:ABC transporter substrate-binding protein n=1 Tax=Paenibacillus antarcticus TaxID=253703 RepID=A0A162KB27_9BACL|nr:extracellular solute-binding protein [Paenibacillus antarcticus]OAB43148.1 hypothetical protein PBAT_19345 [Paenibacillus antarcticus]